MTSRGDLGAVFLEALETLPGVIPAAIAAAYVGDPETGSFHVAQLHRRRPASACGRATRSTTCRPTWRRRCSRSDTEPFIVPVGERPTQVPLEYHLHRRRLRRRARSPRCGGSPTGTGAIVAVAPAGSPFTDRDLSFARGLTDITRLALGNARRLSELERFQELVATLDAAFWEATFDGAFTFVGGRAVSLLGPDAESWPATGASLGGPRARGRP